MREIGGWTQHTADPMKRGDVCSARFSVGVLCHSPPGIPAAHTFPECNKQISPTRPHNQSYPSLPFSIFPMHEPTKARLRGKRSEWARVRSGAWCDSPLLPGTKWKRHGDTLQRDAHESQRATESSDSSEKTLQRCKRARVDTTEIRTISRGGDATLTPTLPFKPTTHIGATPADHR